MSEEKNVSNKTAGADEWLLEVRHLKKYFPIKKSLFGKVQLSTKAVNDVSFTVKKGTTLGVVGESGCGKTTMGRTMLRLYDITGGDVIYKGLSVEKFSTKQLRALTEDEAVCDFAGVEVSAENAKEHRAKLSREELIEVVKRNGVNISKLEKQNIMEFQVMYSADFSYIIAYSSTIKNNLPFLL